MNYFQLHNAMCLASKLSVPEPYPTLAMYETPASFFSSQLQLINALNPGTLANAAL